MDLHLYLWNQEREDFKQQLTDIKEIFFDRIQPIFADTEEEARKWADDFLEKSFYGDYNGEYPDPQDFDDAEEIGYERYSVLEIMKYRTMTNWLSCMCQVWEQQTVLFIKRQHEVLHIPLVDKNQNPIDEFGIDIVIDMFRRYHVDIRNLLCWPKIRELRTLVNVIKHGEGRSANDLRQLRPDMFNNDTELHLFDSMDAYGVSILDVSLAISNQDFTDYYNALIAFWDALPERMFE